MATTFKDSKGRPWAVSITIGRARAVRDATGVDLLTPESGTPSLPEVLGDEFKVASILEVLLVDEFKAKDINPADVMRNDWDGATSRAAYDAFLQELGSFFVGRGQPARASIVQKTHDAIQEALKVVGEKAALLDPAAEVRKLMETEGVRRKTAGSTSGRPLAGSGSTPHR